MGNSNEIIRNSINRAKQLFNVANQMPKTDFLERIEPLLEHQSSKFFLIKLLDTSLRPLKSGAVSKHILGLFSAYPKYNLLFNRLEQFLIKLYKGAGKYFPFISVPLIKKQIIDTTSTVIFEVDSTPFRKLNEVRKLQSVRQNINLIGEALLGEEEASVRIRAYKKLIENPSIDYISIKVSTIFSQISSLAFDETVEKLKPKLRYLYQLCLDVEKQTGKKTFINLDMEEYRDLSITVALFKSVLSEPEFKNYYAGIVLQAYIPDSYSYLLELQEWAKERVAIGGSAVKVRIVKGANLEMEKVESSLKDWPLVTHRSKLATDAQYRKMLMDSLTQGNCKAVHLGVASHNIFDICFAIELVEENKLHGEVDFEMLEGLAENLILLLKDQGVNVLLYTPIIEKDKFLSGIAYLVRRFDEATASGNFIRESINMEMNDSAWNKLELGFVDSFNHIPSLDFSPFRYQNRLNTPEVNETSFVNSPDTDWTLPQNRAWANEIKKRWVKPLDIIPAIIPVYSDKKDRETYKQDSWSGKLPWTIELATLPDYKKALEQSVESKWNDYSVSERSTILRNAGLELEKRRGDLVGIGITEVGKLITELDPEISEAVDFATYYAESIASLSSSPDYSLESSGVNLVLSPWNFPIAIPAGGIFASLASGNPVIVKPAKQSIACAYLLCEILWEAGIPKDALHFLPAHSGTLKPLLEDSSPFASVILTGGTDTATSLLTTNPLLTLNAETGGKNATIVTAFADKDLAIKHVLDSAFGNTGQKCSATSLLILEEEVYNDRHFLILLGDSIRSKKVGSPWEFGTQVGPMAYSVSGALEIENEHPNTNWLVKGKQINSHLLEPSIAIGVKRSDSCFQNELFGPHLSIVKAYDLKDAVEIANSTKFGLTSGLESLNEEEINYWKENIESGNLYINRSTTGAIVKRQPFGGVKLSAFGPGRKAGGQNYLTQFVKVKSNLKSGNSYSYAEKDYQKWYAELFSKEIDELKIRGQANVTRYLKPKNVSLLITHENDAQHFPFVVLACEILKLPLTIYSNQKYDFLESTEYECVEDFSAVLPFINHNVRVRAFDKSRLSLSFLISLHKSGIHVYDSPALPFGRFELLNYLQEQSISHDFHRYGNLME